MSTNPSNDTSYPLQKFQTMGQKPLDYIATTVEPIMQFQNLILVKWPCNPCIFGNLQGTFYIDNFSWTLEENMFSVIAPIRKKVPKQMWI